MQKVKNPSIFDSTTKKYSIRGVQDPFKNSRGEF
jgi:hypothetical protein